MKKAFKSILLTLNILAVLLLLFCYLAVKIPPDKIWFAAFFGLAYPFILLANVVFILLWLILKPLNAVYSVLAVAVGWGFVSRFIQISGQTTTEPGIKIVSYNVRHFYGDGSEKQNINANKIVDFLEEQKADIICLQEVRLRKNSIFNLPETVSKLSTIKHYQYARTSTTFGAVTLTRFPVINMGEIRFDNSKNVAIYTDVVLPADTLRIFNIHLQSYLIDPRKYSIIDSPGITEEEDLAEVREMGTKFKRAFQLRAPQVRQIREVIDQSPYPVLVCGDFNDTPASYSYTVLNRGLNDAFVESGKGIGRTYVGKLPSFRIDNIFYSPVFEAYNFKTSDFYLSDHLPVTCTLIKK